MGQTEFNIFLLTSTILIIVFVIGIFLFLLKYRKRKMLHEIEKRVIQETHQKELLQTQVEVQQQTMQQIGREIHDNVGQKLTLAALYTQQIDYENKFPELKERILSVGNIINDSLQDLRALSKTLAEIKSGSFDLIEYLNDELTIVGKTGICKTMFETNISTYRIDYSTLIVIKRIVQEFLQNSLKHASCQNIFLEIENNNDHLKIKIQDDGIGFNMTEHAAHNGIGLANMRKRAELINASFSFNSEEQKGTQLTLEIKF